MSLSIAGLTKRYPGTEGRHPAALSDVSFTVPSGAFVTLLGPSGCGKSTLLNLIAGLDRPSSGTISIEDRVVCDAAARIFVPPAERNISMVFQSYAIWPHMTVRENVEFPLKHGRMRAKPRGDRDKEVTAALERVRLGALESRPAPLLSGGQQQRVSLARALAQNPSLILLDEPLSNLDAALREEMQREIRGIVSGSGITAVYVTHDQKEALSMSDFIVVLKEGRVEQVGTPREIYYGPVNRFVAEFLGSPNLVEARVIADAGIEFVANCSLGSIRVAKRDGQVCGVGELLTLVLKQEDLQVITDPAAAHAVNNFSLKVEREIFFGDRIEIICIGGADNTERISIYTSARRRPERDAVLVHCRPQDIHYFRDQPEK